MKNGLKNFVSPFEKVAGWKALVIGGAGLVVSAVASGFSGWHANGLLQYGPAPTDLWWNHIVEYSVIWLVPSLLVYGLGALLSRSRIRPIDVFGTMAFAMLPLAVMNLVWLLPGMRGLLDAFSLPVDVNAMMTAVMTPAFGLMAVAMVLAMVLMLVWMFRAVKVSCNLKGWQLWTTWVAGVLVGDVVCRLLLGLMYG